MLVLSMILVAAGTIVPGPAHTATKPTQPSAGAGAPDYWFGTPAITFRHPDSNPDHDYWVFRPTSASPPATTVPIVFLHGWQFGDASNNDSSTNHLVYEGIKNYYDLLVHMARKGAIVIVPRYQRASMCPSPFTPAVCYSDEYAAGNAVWAVKDAMAWMKGTAPYSTGQPNPKPDTAWGMSLVGHSYGGTTAVNVAGRAAANGLPTPKTILAISPGKYSDADIDASLAGIPSTTVLFCVGGSTDTLIVPSMRGCGPTTGEVDILERTNHMTAGYRAWINVPNDGPSPYNTFDPGHNMSFANAAVSGQAPDALDWYGVWKWAIALPWCSRWGGYCDSIYVSSAPFSDLGYWSDGHHYAIPTSAVTVY